MSSHPTHGHQVYRYCVRCAGELARTVVKEGDPERLVCQSCGYVQYLDPKVAGCTIIVKENKLVLLQRAIEPSYGKWVFPGGFVDRGEKVEEAAIRETKEEIGVDARIDGLVGVYSDEGSPVIVVVYAAAIVGGELAPLDEALDLKLYSRQEIPWPELAFPSTRDAITDFCRMFWRV